MPRGSSPSEILTLKRQRNPELTLSHELIESFLMWSKETGLSTNTLTSYGTTLRQVLESMETDKTLDFMEAAMKWLARMRPIMAPASIRAKYFAMTLFCKWSGFEGVMEDYRLPPVPEPDPKPLPGGTASVLEMIHAADDTDTRCIIALQGLCGLRVSEATELDIDSVDLAERIVTVKGKGAKIRKVPISDEALAHIAPAFILASVEGRDRIVRITTSAAKYRVKVIGSSVKADTEPVTTHRLRATFATAFWDETKDERALAEILGHASLEMARHYVKVRMTDMRRGVELIAKVN